LIPIPGTILCAGNSTEDILVWPVDEVVFDRTVWVNDIVRSFGGNGANTSFAVARLGGNVRLVGFIGDDQEGDRVLAQLSDAGVDLRVSRCAMRTPVTVVVVRSDGARCFLHRPGVSRESFAKPIVFTPELTAGCSHFHLANPFAMSKMRAQAGATLARARAAGMTTSLDTGWDNMGQWLDVIGPCLEHLDLLFVNEDEARQLSGRPNACTAAAFFREHGVGATVVKLGARGCAIFDGPGAEDVPGFKVEAVDTTGAGDCFAGAFLAGLQRGMNSTGVARLANAVGALSVERPGATTGLLDYDATVTWMNSR
jgi:sugar/nucleoside kinase (ribokinase family)